MRLVLMMRKRFLHCSRRCRYMISAMLIAIVLLIYIQYRDDSQSTYEYKKCYSIVINEFTDKANKYIYFGKEKTAGILNATELRRWILIQNSHEKVINSELYGPLTPDTLIFVVLVHQYSCNLNYLLASFSEVEGIQDALIIFSHSCVDHNLNLLLKSIEFCRILQIFYPFSIQAYPDEFPGYDKNDCPSNLDGRAAEKVDCTGAMTPDVHGKYRDPTNAEKKHHWWWTANKVFGNLSYTTGHNGMVVFLEHNYYVFKNFIYIAYEMNRIAKTLPQCDFLSLAPTIAMKSVNAYSLMFTTWNPRHHSNIMAIDFAAWGSIVSHYDIFCRTDDSSWSRSLLEVSINRRDGRTFKVLSGTAARVLQTTYESCRDVIDCYSVDVAEILYLQKTNKEFWFPAYFEVIHDIELYDDEFLYADYVEINGGWNDQRDQKLCRNMSINRAKKYSVTVRNTINLETFY